jgi:hypothetical protein
LLPRLVREKRGMFDFGPGVVVTRVVLRLLKRLQNDAGLEQTVRSVLEGLNTIGARFRLVMLVGHRENVGHGLISEEAATGLEQALRAQIREAPAEELAEESELGSLLWWAMREGAGGDAPLVPALESHEVQVALLRDAVTEVRSQELGSYAVRRSYRLSWDHLVGIFGGDERIAEVVTRVKKGQADQRLATAVELAERYLAGWRPGEFGEDDD